MLSETPSALPAIVITKKRGANEAVPVRAEDATVLDAADPVAFPTLTGPAKPLSNAAALEQRQRLLEREEKRDRLFRSERERRSRIMGIEHERRMRLTWDAHSIGGKMLFRENQSKRVLAAWKQQRYLESVRSFQRWSAIWTEEMNAREELLLSEQQAWEYILGCWGIESLQIAAFENLKNRTSAEERWSSTDGVRNYEQDVYLREAKPSKEFRPSVDFYSTAAGGAEKHSGKSRPEYLMDYSVNEEEFSKRQQVRLEEALCRTECTACAEKALQIAVEEYHERLQLHEIFYEGWCTDRLKKIIVIQRWWKQVRCSPWSSWRQKRYRQLMYESRGNRSAADYKLVLQRLEKVFTLSVEEQLVRLDQAAELQYTHLLDTYVFSLQQLYRGFANGELRRYVVKRDRCLWRYPDETVGTITAFESDEEWKKRRSIEKHLEELEGCQELPFRIFSRFPLPYLHWRENRWSAFSSEAIRCGQELFSLESAERAFLESREERNVVGLRVLHQSLCSGLDSVKEVVECLTLFEENEASARLLVQQEENEGRSSLNMAYCCLGNYAEQAFRSVVQLAAEEQRKRRDVCTDEEERRKGLEEQHWRWDRLAIVRARLVKKHGSCTVLRNALSGRLGKKFASVESSKQVLYRFFLRMKDVKLKERERSIDYVASGVLTVRQEEWMYANLHTQLKLLEEQIKARERGLRRDRKARTSEQRENKIKNGSRGFFSCERSLIPGFSYEVSDAVSKAVNEFASLAGQNTQSSAPMAATSVSSWAKFFHLWVEAEADRPREDNYKEVLGRFQSTYLQFYSDFSLLLYLYRETRNKIEQEEEEGRSCFPHRRSYRFCVSFQLQQGEEAAREAISTEEQKERTSLFADLHVMKRSLLWGVQAAHIALAHPSQKRPYHLNLQLHRLRYTQPKRNAPLDKEEVIDEDRPQECRRRTPAEVYDPCSSYVHNGPSLDNILKGELFVVEQVVESPEVTRDQLVEGAKESESVTGDLAPSRLTALERLIAREEVTRTAVDVKRRKELASFLLDFVVPLKEQLLRDCFAACVRRCSRLDRDYPDHRPLACYGLLASEEASDRAVIEQECREAFPDVLVAAHSQFLNECLMKQFTFGHFTMISHARYLDLRLKKLLTQRLRYIDRKISDLIEMEEAARRRMEYTYEITTNVRLRWGKVP